jgi:hypothetical protein
MVLPDRTKAKVEILAEGQQFIADGIHPETHQPYIWSVGTPETVQRPSKALPIDGLHSAFDFLDDTFALYRDGRKRGHSTGWPSVDELMTIAEGRLSVVTGIPGSGKSEFIDAVAVNLAMRCAK